MTPHPLYEWAQSNFDFVTENEYKEVEGLLSSQFATAESVHGTQQLHAFMPVKKGLINTKIYSASPNCTENRVISVLKDMIELKDKSSYKQMVGRGVEGCGF
jgi:hypothetical protein